MRMRHQEPDCPWSPLLMADIDAIDPLGDRLQHLPSFAGLRLLELRNNDRALLATDLEQCSTCRLDQSGNSGIGLKMIASDIVSGW
jgi:hypothetical protein